MIRNAQLRGVLKASLIAALSFSFIMGFAQTGGALDQSAPQWTTIENGAQESVGFGGGACFTCNCNRQTQVNCGGICFAATLTGCGPGGGFPCNGCC